MAIEKKISKLVKEELDAQLEDMREQLSSVFFRINTIPRSPTAWWSS